MDNGEVLLIARSQKQELKEKYMEYTRGGNAIVIGRHG